MGNLSENFSREEFACHGENCCGGVAPVDWNLVSDLQSLRSAIGRPLKISSGFRCKTHNMEVGGELDSYHTLGMAADIICDDEITPDQIKDLAKEICDHINYIIMYNSWVHVDVRTASSVCIEDRRK